jgi:hypothetical protein
VGWVKGGGEVGGTSAGYLWLLQNHAAFRTSPTNFWVSPAGKTNLIEKVLVGTIGDYAPMQDVVDVGPTNWGADTPTNFLGSDASTDVSTHADFTAYYRLLVLKVESVEIYKPETSTDADWQNTANVMDWKEVVFNNEDLKFKIKFTPEIPSKDVFPCEIRIASFVNATPSRVAVSIDANDSLSPDKKELWMTVANSELKSLGLLPNPDGDPPYEQASLDSPLSVNFNDSDKFDAITGNDPRVLARGPGNWTDAPVTWSGKTLPAWSAYAGNGCDYLKAGGASDRGLLQDQADWFYISGHGSHSAGTVCGVGPTEVDWGHDLAVVVMAGCSVLDIDDLNGNFDDDNADGDNDPHTGTEVGPASQVFPGELWATTGPYLFMGYNSYAPADDHNGDPQFTAKIIEKQHYYRGSYTDWESWKRANDDMAGGWGDSPYNACCIHVNSSTYYYFDKGLYVPVWTSYSY